MINIPLDRDGQIKLVNTMMRDATALKKICTRMQANPRWWWFWKLWIKIRYRKYRKHRTI